MTDEPKQTKKEIAKHVDKFTDSGKGMVIHTPRKPPAPPLPR